MPNRYKRRACHNSVEIRVVLKNKAITSRFNPYTLIRNDAILPAINKVKSPSMGEKTIGKRTGRLIICLVVAKGCTTSPKSVFAQM